MIKPIISYLDLNSDANRSFKKKKSSLSKISDLDTQTKRLISEYLRCHPLTRVRK